MSDNVESLCKPAQRSHENIAHRIVAELVGCRRTSPDEPSTADAQASAVQFPRVLAYVARNAPVDMVLPAFPAKSPNTAKVLGDLPDLAEQVSLAHLDALCARIGAFYPPGAHLQLCADGHVFADHIDVLDATVGRYQQAIAELIQTSDHRHLTLFNLDNAADYRALAPDYAAMRARLDDEFGEPLDTLRERLLGSAENLALYRGVTRFIFEDGLTPSYAGSRTALQRRAKTRALNVIQRSWAWGNLLAARDPDAIRLSIHPQAATSIKLGVRLMPSDDEWLTPWHGVAIVDNGQCRLVKRRDAEGCGARLVHVDGRPSHYVAQNTMRVADR